MKRIVVCAVLVVKFILYSLLDLGVGRDTYQHVKLSFNRLTLGKTFVLSLISLATEAAALVNRAYSIRVEITRCVALMLRGITVQSTLVSQRSGFSDDIIEEPKEETIGKAHKLSDEDTDDHWSKIVAKTLERIVFGFWV